MSAAGPLSPEQAEKIKNAKIFVVGAGGVGCELLKGLVLTGFKNITIIDMDTIDTSNLNRQFLFQNKHVGQAKSKVARESALKFVPDANIEALVGSILSPEYDMEFFQQFQLVLSALDNIKARKRVNAMAIGAEIPLIESGTSGYLGQVTSIIAGKTMCYDCETKSEPKTYPVCTIHRTPSTIVHCIVWAKLVFSLLFGEPTFDDEIPRGEGEGVKNLEEDDAEKEVTSALKSLKEWSMSNNFDPHKLFDRIFFEDIGYLLIMKDLYKERKPPIPVKWDEVLAKEEQEPNPKISKEMQVWTMKQCLKVFEESLMTLRDRYKESNYEAPMDWDKDDEPCLDFVAAISNLRAYIFHLEPINRFELKSKAGNIIPAIATANAMIAGSIVMESIKMISKDFGISRQVVLRDASSANARLVLKAVAPDLPVSSCSTCSTVSAPKVKVNIDAMTKDTFTEKILKENFKIVDPEARIFPSGIIFISPDIEVNGQAKLSSFGITTGTRIFCEDLENDSNLSFVVNHGKNMSENDFEVKLHPKEAEENSNRNGVSTGSRKRPGEEQDEWRSSKRKRITSTPDWIPDCISDSDDDVEIFYEPKKIKVVN